MNVSQLGWATAASPFLLAFLYACAQPLQDPQTIDTLPVVKLSPSVLKFKSAALQPVSYHVRNTHSNETAKIYHVPAAVFTRDDDAERYTLTCKDLDREISVTLTRMVLAKNFLEDNKARSQLQQFQIAQAVIDCPTIKI